MTLHYTVTRMWNWKVDFRFLRLCTYSSLMHPNNWTRSSFEAVAGYAEYWVYSQEQHHLLPSASTGYGLCNNP